MTLRAMSCLDFKVEVVVVGVEGADPFRCAPGIVRRTRTVEMRRGVERGGFSRLPLSVQPQAQWTQGGPA